MKTRQSPAKAKAPAKTPVKAVKAVTPAKAGVKKVVKPAASSAKQTRTARVPAKKAATHANAATQTRTRTKAKASASTSPERSSNSPSELLRAGLNALSLPRAESAVADGLSKIADSFGLKKLEDVFDHRVASALERLGYPSASELRKLSLQIEELVKLLKTPKKRS